MASDQLPRWISALCGVATVWNQPGQKSIRDLFADAAPDLTDRGAFEAAVEAEARAHPALLRKWQRFNEDKRDTPSPVFDGRDVLWVEDTGKDSEHVTHHPNRFRAFADYLYREAKWVLERERLDS